METSTIQRFKNRASELLESRLIKTGRLLDVRHWENAALTEIDLHLPEAAMEFWADVPYIKLKIAAFTYRDYTPFAWDAETHTCSLLIDTAHVGPGSLWAKSIQPGETIQYLGIDSSRQSPHPTDLVVGIGDASSLAHLLALQQLTLPRTRFDGAVLLQNSIQKELFSAYFQSPLVPISDEQELTSWLQAQEYCINHTQFYLTGNHHLVGRLRRSLKAIGYKQIKHKGFWS
ncbi:MAG: hypothetical protein EOO88_08830 [Pedobacter sp.]|nr:MAG: hypothetical protein EOO88_08830 [Pedobacter sp.]